MDKWLFFFLIGLFILGCKGAEPYRPKTGVLPFVVYYPSRYRGICIGSLISPTAVLTAAICVTSPDGARDKRPINVVTGTSYRYHGRGIRVQVLAVFIPKYKDVQKKIRGYMMIRSPAVLILRRKVPDILAEIPLRPIDIDLSGDNLNIQEECLMAGWHYFYKGDKIYPGGKFLLQRNLRAQILIVAEKNRWCAELYSRFRNTLQELGFLESPTKEPESVCIRDPDATAQPCHGMYGAPLICRAKIVGLMLAPDAQWLNCTGFTNLIHRFDNSLLRKFMGCMYRLVEIDHPLDWASMKREHGSQTSDEKAIEYDSDIYDRILSTSDEWNTNSTLNKT